MMKRAFIFLWLSLLLPLMATAQTNYFRHDIEPRWQTPNFESGSGSGIVKSLVDDEGNVFVLGSYGGMQDRFNNTLICPADTLYHGTEEGAFVAKIDPNGNTLWIRSVESSSGLAIAHDMALSNGTVSFLFTLDHFWPNAYSRAWLYILDTLYVKPSGQSLQDCGFPHLYDTVWVTYEFLATLDLNGNVLSTHAFAQKGPQFDMVPADALLSRDKEGNSYILANITNADTLCLRVDRDPSQTYTRGYSPQSSQQRGNKIRHSLQRRLGQVPIRFHCTYPKQSGC